MGLDNLWKPDLRGRIEQGIARIAAGQVAKEQACREAGGQGVGWLCVSKEERGQGRLWNL